MSFKGNGAIIENEIAWFNALLERRIESYFAGDHALDLIESLPPPPMAEQDEPYATGVREAGLGPSERLVLILALLPALRPQALDAFLMTNRTTGGPFSEFGGGPGEPRRGFLPTRETALFLIAGMSMERRLRALLLFAPEAPLQSLGILEEPIGCAGPWAPLVPATEWLERLIRG